MHVGPEATVEPADKPVWPDGAVMEGPATEPNGMTGDSDEEFDDPGAYFQAMSEFLMRTYYDSTSMSAQPNPEPCKALKSKVCTTTSC